MMKNGMLFAAALSVTLLVVRGGSALAQEWTLEKDQLVEQPKPYSPYLDKHIPPHYARWVGGERYQPGPDLLGEVPADLLAKIGPAHPNIPDESNPTSDPSRGDAAVGQGKAPGSHWEFRGR